MINLDSIFKSRDITLPTKVRLVKAMVFHEAEYLLRQSDTHTLVMIESALDSNYKNIINEICPEIEKTKAGQPLHCTAFKHSSNPETL